MNKKQQLRRCGKSPKPTFLETKTQEKINRKRAPTFRCGAPHGAPIGAPRGAPNFTQLVSL